MSENYRHVILLSTEKGVNSSVTRFFKDLLSGFQSIGVGAEWRSVDAKSLAVARQDQEKMTAGGTPTFLFEVNGRIETYDSPKFSWFVDHPLQHPQVGQLSPDTVAGFVDQSHVELEGFIPCKHKVFLPHGGPPADPDRRPMKDRDIPLLFCGNIMRDPTVDNVALAFKNSTAPLPEVAMSAFLKITEQKRQPAFAVFRSLLEKGVDPGALGREGLTKFYTLIESFSQAHERLAILGELEGCAVHMVGIFQDNIKRILPSDAVYLGEKGFDDIVSLMGRTKFVINPTHKFSRGSHERVWYGLAKGAMILANQSKYIDQTFHEGEGILSYRPAFEKGTIAEIVTDLLNTPTEMDRQGHIGKKIYSQNHLWTHRAQTILTAMNKSR